MSPFQEMVFDPGKKMRPGFWTKGRNDIQDYGGHGLHPHPRESEYKLFGVTRSACDAYHKGCNGSVTAM